MNELDPTGARANSAGFTKEAIRAERRRIAKAKWDARWKWLGSNIPKALMYAIIVAVLTAATLFDWFMSSRGWQDILPGLGIFAWAGAAASVGFWYFGAFKTGEELYEQRGKAKDKRDYVEAYVWGTVSLVAYVVCVGGVIVATITNTSQAKFAAQESRQEYAQLLAKRDALAETLDLYSVEYWQQRVEADTRQARGQLNIAKATLGMKDLDVDGGCAQKLSFDQRRACALWNGGLDPHTGVEVLGAIAEIAQSQAGLDKAVENETALKELELQVASYVVKTGDETARALGEYFQSETAGNQVLMFIIAFFSAGFLLCGGLFGHGAVRMLKREAL